MSVLLDVAPVGSRFPIAARPREGVFMRRSARFFAPLVGAACLGGWLIGSHLGLREPGVATTTDAPAYPLRSLTGQAFTIIEAKSGCPEVKVTPISAADRHYSIETKTVAPTDAQRTRVSFRVREADGTEYEIAIPVHYEVKTAPAPQNVVRG